MDNHLFSDLGVQGEIPSPYFKRHSQLVFQSDWFLEAMSFVKGAAVKTDTKLDSNLIQILSTKTDKSNRINVENQNLISHA